MRALFIAALVLRVWWGSTPQASGIFVRRIQMTERNGTKANYFVVKQPGGFFLVREDDIIKTAPSEEAGS